jgi:hypothetical protein
MHKKLPIVTKIVIKTVFIRFTALVFLSVTSDFLKKTTFGLITLKSLTSRQFMSHFKEN